MKRRFNLFTLIAAMMLTAAVTFVAVSTFSGAHLDPELKKEVNLYAELRQIIDDIYIGEYDSQQVSDAVMDAAVAAIGDRWSYYMTAEEYEEYKLSQQNKYAGIGVTVESAETGGLLIKAVQAGTPAENAGLQAGETIIAVDGTDITGMTISEAKELIKARTGESFGIRVRSVEGTERDVTLNCEIIYKTPVSYELLENSVGLITIENFEAGVCDDFMAAVEDLQAQGAESLIFDVRNNPGGLVSELTAMLDYLLPEGEIFISVDKSGGERVETSGPSCVEMPMAVLVNENSYSAAEFFAAALREYDWATVVGWQTTGKGRSQITRLLSDGSALHISTRKYMTPGRVDLSETGGLTPDVEVEISEEDFALLYYDQLSREDDEQLQAAVTAVALRGY